MNGEPSTDETTIELVVGHESMAHPLNLTGQKFHALTVVARNGSTRQGKALWRCMCDCGKETTVIASPLQCGRIKSCGCARLAAAVERGLKLRRIDYGSVKCVRCGTSQAHRFIDGGKVTEHLTIDRLQHVMCRECRNEVSIDNGRTESYRNAKIHATRFHVDVIVGSILGDGSLERSVGGAHTNWCLSVKHGLRQTAYCRWKYELLGELGSKISTSRDRIRFRTKHHPVITRLAQQFIVGGRKSVNAEAVTVMGPLGYAIWYMDDDNLLPHRISKKGIKRKPEIRFSTSAFTDSENAVLREALELEFGVETTPCMWSSAIKSKFNKTGEKKTYYGIRLYGDNVIRFLDAIRSCVDLKATGMGYKFDTTERGPLDNKYTRRRAK